MEIPLEFLGAFPPSTDLLLDRARRDIDDETLLEIARADYGCLADEMLADLRIIRDTGLIPSPIHGQLVEVLELTRWCNPEKPNAPPFEPGPTGRRGHQARLFACAVLLRAAAEPACRYDDCSDDSTLARGLDSARVLGIELSEALGCFLTWQLPRVERQPEWVLDALGLLILAVRLRSNRFADSELGKIAEWVLDEEALFRQTFGWNPTIPRPIAFSLQQGFWETLAAELKSEAAAIETASVRSNIELCALALEIDYEI